MNMTKGVVLTVGNSLMGDDAAGPLLGALLIDAPAPDWHVIDGGSAPENKVHQIRALAPSRVLIVDATEMDLSPGEIRIIDDDIIAEQPFVTTHVLPLTFLMEALREFVSDVQLLGIQPSVVAFSFPLSEAVENAVHDLHENLTRGCGTEIYEHL